MQNEGADCQGWKQMSSYEVVRHEILCRPILEVKGISENEKEEVDLRGCKFVISLRDH